MKLQGEFFGLTASRVQRPTYHPVDVDVLALDVDGVQQVQSGLELHPGALEEDQGQGLVNLLLVFEFFSDDQFLGVVHQKEFGVELGPTRKKVQDFVATHEQLHVEGRFVLIHDLVEQVDVFPISYKKVLCAICLQRASCFGRLRVRMF